MEYNNEKKIIKVLNLDGIKEKKILKFSEIHNLLFECCASLSYHSKMFILNNNSDCVFIYRKYYFNDLESLIVYRSIADGDIYNIIFSISTILIILSDNNLIVDSLKTSNVIYDNKLINDNIKLCDLFLNSLRKENEMRIYDISFISPEEMSELEINERSVIWSIGCILYEMLNKKLPFSEDDNLNKTTNNILKCKYNQDIIKDSYIKQILGRMLEIDSEDRISLNELRKEMIKQGEILRDDEGNLMIIKERRDLLLNNDNAIVTLPIIYPPEYYYGNKKWKSMIII